MIMLGFGKFLKYAAVAAAALVIASCGGSGNKKGAAKSGDGVNMPSKENMIPDAAIMAVKVDADQLCNKALGDPGSEGRAIWDMCKAYLSMYLGDYGEVGTLVRNFLKDPSYVGVSFDEPMVLSVSADTEEYSSSQMSMEIYLTTILTDSDAFVNAVDAVMDLVNEESDFSLTKEVLGDSYTYYACTLDDGITVDLGVASKSAVLRFKASTIAKGQGLKSSMLSLFANGGPEKTEALKAFYASKADAAFWADVDGAIKMAMPVLKESEPSLVAQYKAIMDQEISTVSELNFNDGETVLEVKVFGSEDMKARAMKYNTASTDKYFAYIPSSSVFVANFAIKDFAGIVDEVSKMGKEYADAVEYLEEIGIDDELLAGFPGVITFALDGTGIDYRDVPGLSFYMDCDRNVWEYIEEQFGENMDPLGPGAYQISDELYVVYEDGTLCLTTGYEFWDSFSSTDLSSEIETGGFAFNMEALPYNLLYDLADEVGCSVGDILDVFSSAVITMSDDFTATTLTLNMGDKEHNLLEKIVLLGASSIF